MDTKTERQEPTKTVKSSIGRTFVLSFIWFWWPATMNGISRLSPFKGLKVRSEFHQKKLVLLRRNHTRNVEVLFKLKALHAWRLWHVVFLLLFDFFFHRVVGGFCWYSAEMGPTWEGVVATPAMILKEALGLDFVLQKTHHSSLYLTSWTAQLRMFTGQTPKNTTVRPSKHFFTCALTRLGSFVSLKISNKLSLDRKKKRGKKSRLVSK